MAGKQRAWRGLVLLAALVGPLAWYSRAIYRAGHDPIPRREKRLTPHDALLDVHLRGSGRGWIAGKYGLMLHTEDGGESWKVQEAGTTRTLTSVSFADDRHGFTVGSEGLVLATTDGGLSWKTRSSGTREHLLGVQALSQTKACAVGAFGTILYTADGGAVWKQPRLCWEKLIPRLIQELGYLEPNLNAVCFVRPEVGWIAGEFGLVLHTTDGGQTWASQRYGRDLPQLVALQFYDEHAGLAVGQQGALLKTTDGGTRWVGVRSGTKRGLYGIALSGNDGVIVGDGVVLKTDDGGHSWAQAQAVPQHLWFSGVAMRGKKAMAVGQAGTLLLMDLKAQTASPSERRWRDETLGGMALRP